MKKGVVSLRTMQKPSAGIVWQPIKDMLRRRIIWAAAMTEGSVSLRTMQQQLAGIVLQLIRDCPLGSII